MERHRGVIMLRFSFTMACHARRAPLPTLERSACFPSVAPLRKQTSTSRGMERFASREKMSAKPSSFCGRRVLWPPFPPQNVFFSVRASCPTLMFIHVLRKEKQWPPLMPSWWTVGDLNFRKTDGRSSVKCRQSLHFFEFPPKITLTK